MFDKVIELFDNYYRLADQLSGTDLNRDLAMEVRDRLVLMNDVIRRVIAAQQRLEASIARSQEAFRSHIVQLEEAGVPYESAPAPEGVRATPEQLTQYQQAWRDIELFTEMFYHLGHRVRVIIRHKVQPLPHLGSFEASGVRDVRNHLLEHPESKDSQVFARSFGAGGANGPVVKSIRETGHEEVWPDQGLFFNAREFDLNLRQSINDGIVKLSA